MTTPDPRFPIGKFHRPSELTQDLRRAHIDDLRRTPQWMRNAVSGLTEAQLDTPYREGGWSVRQVVHHVPDSHMNAYIRLKWALTEDTPVIKTYHEDLWAELADSRTSIDVSLTLLDALHDRWVRLLESLSEPQWERGFRHPELGEMKLPMQLALYSWHCRHHVAHITSLRERMGW